MHSLHFWNSTSSFGFGCIQRWEDFWSTGEYTPWSTECHFTCWFSSWSHLDTVTGISYFENFVSQVTKIVKLNRWNTVRESKLDDVIPWKCCKLSKPQTQYKERGKKSPKHQLLSELHSSLTDCRRMLKVLGRQTEHAVVMPYSLKKFNLLRDAKSPRFHCR